MSKLPVASFAAIVLAMAGPLCAQEQEFAGPELGAATSGDGLTQQDKTGGDEPDAALPANRFNPPDRRLYAEPDQRFQAAGDCGCDANCDADAPESRCFDGHRLRDAMEGWSSLLPPAPAGTSLPTDSWNRYPLSAGWFLGGAEGGEVMSDWLGLSGGMFGGGRVGWDVNSHMGVEARMAFGSLDVYDSYRAVQAELASGVLPSAEQAAGTRQGDVFEFDAEVLLYPWGDTRWRPYVLFGLGGTHLYFADRLTQTYTTTGLSMPLGIGVKYLWNDRLDIRFDLIDDVAFPARSDFNTVNLVSFTGGIELRFGGTRQVYWPYDPDYKYW